MFYSVQQGSRYILSLTNQRSWFEVRRFQYHQQIKSHWNWIPHQGISSLNYWCDHFKYGSSLKVAISILKKFLRPLGSSDDTFCTKAWYAPYWFLLAIQDLTHNLTKQFPLYCWIPAAISKIQMDDNVFSQDSPFWWNNFPWNMLLDLVCKLTRIMMQKVAWYKYRDTCFTM
jgi:hypothetical protein